MKAYLVDANGHILGTTGISVIPGTDETIHLTEGSVEAIPPPDGTAFRVEDVRIIVTVSALNTQTLAYMLHMQDEVRPLHLIGIDATDTLFQCGICGEEWLFNPLMFKDDPDPEKRKIAYCPGKGVTHEVDRA